MDNSKLISKHLSSYLLESNMSDLIEKENTTALDSELDHGSNPFFFAAVCRRCRSSAIWYRASIYTPGIGHSFLGPEPKVFWYLSTRLQRSSRICCCGHPWYLDCFCPAGQQRSGRVDLPQMIFTNLSALPV